MLIQTAFLAFFVIVSLVSLLVILAVKSEEARKRAKDLNESRRRFASTVNASLDAIIVADMEGRVIDFNPAAEQTFGYTRNAAIGQKMDELIILQKHRKAHRAGMKRF